MQTIIAGIVDHYHKQVHNIDHCEIGKGKEAVVEQLITNDQEDNKDVT
jgi:hypothetical protein